MPAKRKKPGPDGNYTVAFKDLPKDGKLLRPERTYVFRDEGDGEEVVLMQKDDARVLMKHLWRTSPWFVEWMKRPRDHVEPPPPTEPHEQLEEWLHQFKNRETERTEEALEMHAFLSRFDDVWMPPTYGEAKEAYDWMQQQTKRTCNDPMLPVLGFPSVAEILRNFDKWKEVHGHLVYYSL